MRCEEDIPYQSIHLWSGGREKAGGLSRLSLMRLFAYLFVLLVPMLREIYAHVEAVDLSELMRLVGFIYGNLFPQYNKIDQVSCILELRYYLIEWYRWGPTSTTQTSAPVLTLIQSSWSALRGSGSSLEDQGTLVKPISTCLRSIQRLGGSDYWAG